MNLKWQEDCTWLLFLTALGVSVFISFKRQGVGVVREHGQGLYDRTNSRLM